MKDRIALLAAGLCLSATSLVVAQELPPPRAPELLVAPQAQPQEGVRLAPKSEQFVPLVPEKKPLTLYNYAAMERAAERRARLDAQAWYGYSPLRPTVQVTGFSTFVPQRVAVAPIGFGYGYASPGWAMRSGGPVVTYHQAR